jgi:hypothetical protein
MLGAATLPVVLPGEAREAVTVDLAAAGRGDHAVGDGDEGGGAAAVLEQGTFAHDRTGAELGDLAPST